MEKAGEVVCGVVLPISVLRHLIGLNHDLLLFGNSSVEVFCKLSLPSTCEPTRRDITCAGCPRSPSEANVSWFIVTVYYNKEIKCHFGVWHIRIYCSVPSQIHLELLNRKQVHEWGGAPFIAVKS